MRTKVKGSKVVEGARKVSTGIARKVANVFFVVPYKRNGRAPKI